jgi:signal transduction histidine kinase
MRSEDDRGVGGLGQRRLRNYLVDPGIQLRLVSYMLVVATAIGCALAVMVWTAGQEAGPGLFLGAALAGAVPGMLVLAVVLTHRVAGPAVALAHACRRVGAGDLSLPRPLRRRDLLVDLADEVALMVEGLREQEAEERALLADAAHRIRRAGEFAGGHELATRLEVLASRKSQRLGLFA